MVRATLRPPALSTEISVDIVRAAIADSKAQALKRLQETRHRCARYSRLARQRAFSAGYAAGLHAAQDDFQAAIKAITTTYDAALEMAKRDAAILGQMLAARIIDQTLSNQPEILLRWIDEGARILATSRTFTLSYNPRYTALITSLEGRLSDRITTWVPANLGQVDFVLSGDGGGIECSWRKALLEGE